MVTPAIYTFKGDNSAGREDIHLVHKWDGRPDTAAGKIPDLSGVAVRLWDGEQVDLESLNLPSVDSVSRLNDLDSLTSPTSFRYEIELVDGRPIMVKAFRNEPAVPEELKERLQAAHAALEAVRDEMDAAHNIPNYIEIKSGDLAEIRKLGDGYGDED